MFFTDTHAHLNDPAFYQDLPQIIENAKKNNVKAIVVCGYDLKSSEHAIELSKKYPCIYATVGIHPHDAKTWDDNTQQELIRLSQIKKVVAIGEIGLDYHYDNSPRDIQADVFLKQIHLAGTLNMPIVIHSRKANQDTMRILKENINHIKSCVYHCFSGSIDFAKEVLDMGFFIGIDGPITYKSSPKLKRIISETPIDRLVLETDSPYLTPVPNRGKRNEPANIIYIAKAVAELKGISLEELCKITTKNAERLYGVSFSS